MHHDATQPRGLWRFPILRRYRFLVRRDLAATYSRDLHKWILIAPVMGGIIGLVITLLVKIILQWIWPPLLREYIAHPLVIVPGLAIGFLVAGLVMQYWTPNPNEHSTEEIIASYHERQGAVAGRAFLPKLLAAVATVGSGGSAALEGPSIYAGGAIGSWLWSRLRRMGIRLEPHDRRILLISGAAAGMSAVFHAPFTGVIFALEMPYKDDMAHEALMPALLASVTAFATLASLTGGQPLFNFAASHTYTRQDLLWAALLGGICGLITMPFTITFRRLREFVVRHPAPHWLKMAVGGALTGLCGLAFLYFFPGHLVPLGPNYEAVPLILQHAHSSLELAVFAALKLLATLFSLGVGGVSAMFVPLFLTGGAVGTAFAQSVVHTGALNLFAAVGMAAFIAAGYKTPLTAVVFVAEATGGHAYIIPVLIGSAVAYAISGQASASGDQRLHEGVTVEELTKIRVSEVMQAQVTAAPADATLAEWAAANSPSQRPHAAYPVLDQGRVVGTLTLAALGRAAPSAWETTRVRDIMNTAWTRVDPESSLQEALHLLMAHGKHLLMITADDGELRGILSQTDILAALNAAGDREELHAEEAAERN